MVTDDRAENLLALILVTQIRERPLREKAGLLSTAGFTNFEIADLLDTSPAVIAQVLYEARRVGGKKRNKKRARRRA